MTEPWIVQHGRENPGHVTTEALREPAWCTTCGSKSPAYELASDLGSYASIDPVTEPPSIVFEVPKVRWPTEGTFTLVRDLDVHVGSRFTLTDRAGVETVYRVTHVDVPDDDDPDPRWTVSVVEWSPDVDLLTDR